MRTDLPEGMHRRNRPDDQVFGGREDLYRRFPPIFWDGSDPDIETIPLPDMSVMRSKYAERPEWALLELREEDDFEGWGVLTFRVEDIPPELMHLGVEAYGFKVVHVPLRRNYPHSEVRAFRGSARIRSKQEIPPEVHLRFRTQLSWKLRVLIRPQV